MSRYFHKPYEPFGGNINVKVGLSNYAIKADLKNATGIDTSSFAKKTDLASLKSNVDKLGIDKLKTVPDDLSNLKTTRIAKINEIRGEIPSISNLATTTALTAVENKIPNVSNLVKKTDYNSKN